VHVVIMGCGRVGSTLAHSLEKHGHSVAIIDRTAESFRRLRPDFRGQQVIGFGFDRDTLTEARTKEAHAFAAVSSGDNSNIIAARVARETFGVETVVARIYDPKRAEVYQRLGIPTVATVRWTADRVLRRIDPDGPAGEWRDPSGQVVMEEAAYHSGWLGRRVSDLEEATGVKAVCLSRLGDGRLPGPNTVLQEGDQLYVMMPSNRSKEVAGLLRSAPPARGGH
jgi:trk system potassium uptake protein TrkA